MSNTTNNNKQIESTLKSLIDSSLVDNAINNRKEFNQFIMSDLRTLCDKLFPTVKVDNSHITQRKENVNTVMYDIFGANKARTTYNNLVKDGTIDINTMYKKGATVNVNNSKFPLAGSSQLAFICQQMYKLNSAKLSQRAINFLAQKSQDGKQAFSPKDVQNCIIYCGSMKVKTFADLQIEYARRDQVKRAAK